MRFYTDTEEFIFEDDSQYPASYPYEMMQVKDRSAGGTTHVETYASAVRGRKLNFEQMPESDYLGLLDWFINVVNGMAETFSFEDERGSTYTVRFVTRIIDFPETSFQRFSGKVELEFIQNA